MRNTSTKNTMTIRIDTVDGEVHVFSMAAPPDNGMDYTVGSKIEKFLNQQSVAFAVEGELVIIPMHQIKSIRISPLLSKLPEAVVATVDRIPS